MSYTVKQKINGRVYLYEVVSYWDKDKKQPRQRRTYLGPEKHSSDKKLLKKYNLEQICAQLIHKKYGNIFLLDMISRSMGLRDLLKEIFPSSYKDILSLAFFSICSGGEAFYLYPHWLCEQHVPECRMLYSKEISSLTEEIGISQRAIIDFFKRWTEIQNTSKNVYYDITSISSYSVNNNYVEWGHNRDGENLPQINIGIMCSRETGLPLFYQVYPGSIVDVTTLLNTLKYTESYHLKDITIILDRGFCSKENIVKLNSYTNMTFLQPLSFSLRKTKELIRSVKNTIKRTKNAFKHNEEILHYQKTEFVMGDITCWAHIYYNEKAELDTKHNFLNKLFEIEQKIPFGKFESMKNSLSYKYNYIPEEYLRFFKLNKKTMMIEKNARIIAKHLQTNGYFVIISNSNEFKKETVLNFYRDRDIVEKLFDIKKKSIGWNRLRSHSKYNMDGRIFIKFVSLILYSWLYTEMSKTKLFDTYSVKELLAELEKIKYTELEKNNYMISELTRIQKNIFTTIGIDFTVLKHSY